MGVKWSKTTASSKIAKSLFSYEAKNIDGVPTPLSKYKGTKALIVCNVASKCGLTSRHYKELVEMRDKFRQSNDGQFEILGFPCAQFLDQEYHDPARIKEFVAKFNVNFPLFELTKVNGGDASPIFQFLKYNTDELSDRAKSPPVLKPIGWNFGKFLVDSEGHVVKYYGPKTPAASLTEDVEKVIRGELHGSCHEVPSDVDAGAETVGNEESCVRN